MVDAKRLSGAFSREPRYPLFQAHAASDLAYGATPKPDAHQRYQSYGIDHGRVRAPAGDPWRGPGAAFGYAGSSGGGSGKGASGSLESSPGAGARAGGGGGGGSLAVGLGGGESQSTVAGSSRAMKLEAAPASVFSTSGGALSAPGMWSSSLASSVEALGSSQGDTVAARAR